MLDLRNRLLKLDSLFTRCLGSVVRFIEWPFVIDLQESLAILGGPADFLPLGQNDRPGNQGEREQDEENELDDWAGLEDQAEDVEAHVKPPPRLLRAGTAFQNSQIPGLTAGDLFRGGWRIL